MEPFQATVSTPCHEFEQKMNLYGFLSNDETRGNNGPLTVTVETLYTHFLSARRVEILAKARSLVLSDYHNTMLATGDALEDDTSSAGNIGDRQALLEQSGRLLLLCYRDQHHGVLLCTYTYKIQVLVIWSICVQGTEACHRMHATDSR